MYTLKDFDDYYLNFSVSFADCVFPADDVKIERVEPEIVVEPGEPVELTAAGAKYKRNFASMPIGKLIYYFEPDGSGAAFAENKDGKALQITKTGSWSGLNLKNFVFAAKGTYAVSFDVRMTNKHAWDTDNFFVTMGDNTQYKKTENIGDKLLEGETAHLSLTFVLDDYGEYSLNFSHYGGDSVYLIDNVVIEKV